MKHTRPIASAAALHWVNEEAAIERRSPAHRLRAAHVTRPCARDDHEPHVQHRVRDVAAAAAAAAAAAREHVLQVADMPQEARA